MTQKAISMIIFDEIKAHPIIYPVSCAFVVVGLAQFFGLLEGFLSGRVVGLLLSLFAMQSIVLLSTSRSSLSEFMQSVSKDLKSKINGQPSLPDAGNQMGLFDMPDSLSDVFSDAKKIMVVGVSASGIIEAYSDEIRNRSKEEDKSTRFLLVHPDSEALQLVSQRDNTKLRDAIIYQRSRTEDQLDILNKLRNDANGPFSIRRSEYPIDCEYILADYGQFKAIYLRHYTFKTGLGSELKIALKHKQTPSFEHYHRHLKKLWEYGDDFTA